MPDRQQHSTAFRDATRAQEQFPAVQAGVFKPKQLVRQARFVLDARTLQGGRRARRPISEARVSKVIRSVEIFCGALHALGVRVPGLLHVKKRHYLAVVRYWESNPPGDVQNVHSISSDLHWMFAMIGQPYIVLRLSKRIELFQQRGLQLGGSRGFVVNSYIDWRAEALDALAVFQTIADPGLVIAARMMFNWGMSAGEVARWTVVNPGETSALKIDGLHARRFVRHAEFSVDPIVRVEQLQVLRDAWQYCREYGRGTLRRAQETPEAYVSRLNGAVQTALSATLGTRRVTPGQLRDAFFCQVFKDHCGLTLIKATQDPAAASNVSAALAWNEAKRQMGSSGSRVAKASAGLTLEQRRSRLLALQLRECSYELGELGVVAAWASGSDTAALFMVTVSLAGGASFMALPRIKELLERCAFRKLCVLELKPGEVVAP